MTNDHQISEAYKTFRYLWHLCIDLGLTGGESAGVALYYVSDIQLLNQELIPCVRAQLCNHSSSLYSIMSAKSQVT